MAQVYSYIREGDRFQELITEVLKRHVSPEDKYEIAAILEASGLNDERAQEEYGAADIFDLAEKVWLAMQDRIAKHTFQKVPKMSALAYLSMIIRSFLRGMIFALPMAISVLAMLTLRFSLWSYVNLSVELATAIAIGTIMSFMTVGGFTQAIARRGFMYIRIGYFNMARKITFFFVRLGYIVCTIIFVMYLLVNAFFGVFPIRMTIVILLYYIFLSAIWLSVTIMYILQRELAFTGLLVAGIFTVYIFFIILQYDIIVSQLITLFLVAIAGALLAFNFMKIAERNMEKGIAPALPRTSITIYTVLPYFIYGFLYFTFLFTDRVIAWSTSDIYMPYLIWFRGPYELGLDFGLITLILPMGFIEVVVNEFMANMESHQKNYLGSEAPALGRRYLGLYLRRIVIVSIFSIITAVIVYFVVRFIHLTSWLSIDYSLLNNSTTHFVFIVALVAYTILCLGLLNALILFSVAQPEMVGRSILIALIANLLIGFPLSRWFDHSYAVLGLLVGTVIFVIFTFRWVIKVLKDIDYYLYAAS